MLRSLATLTFLVAFIANPTIEPAVDTVFESTRTGSHSDLCDGFDIASIGTASMTVNATQVRWWRRDFDRAFEVAKNRNVPLLIAVIQDGEEANERLVDGLFDDRKFVELTESTVPMICSRKRHGNRRQELDGTVVSSCKRFGSVPCEVHVSHERDMYGTFFGGESLKTPQIMAVLPDQTVVDRVIDVGGFGQYQAIVRAAQKKLGVGMSRIEYKKADSALRDGRRALAQKRYVDAWNAVKDLAKLPKNSDIGKGARRIVSEALAEADRMIEAASAAFEAKDFWTVFETTEKIRDAYPGTPVAKRCVTLEKAAKKDRAGRKAAQAFKKQRRYLPDWKKAQAFEKKRDYGKAHDLYAKIVKRAKGLPLAKRAQERLDHFDADAAIRRLLKFEKDEKAAKKLLRDAERLRRKKQLAAAKKIYEQIVKDYPATDAAEKAAKRLK